MIARKNIAYSQECMLELYLPENAEKPPLYIHFHGGGLEKGDYRRSPEIAAFYTENGVALASAGYRLYPRARFPDYLNDAANAVRWLLEESGESFGPVVIGGDSAGAYISMMLYFDPAYLRNAGVDPKGIKGYLFNGGQPTTHFNYLHYEKQMDPRSVVIDETAPIFYVREPYAHPAGEPELFFVCAENDMVNRVNQNKMLITAMEAFGFPKEKCRFKIYPGETHCSYTKKVFYLQDALDFIKKAANV